MKTIRDWGLESSSLAVTDAISLPIHELSQQLFSKCIRSVYDYVCNDIEYVVEDTNTEVEIPVLLYIKEKVG